jgi:hypothetical protein
MKNQYRGVCAEDESQQIAMLNAYNTSERNGRIQSGSISGWHGFWLDAFNHDPTNDGFASLLDQAKANTNYSNQQFLSYYGDLPVKYYEMDSRVKLTCLTTV